MTHRADSTGIFNALTGGRGAATMAKMTKIIITPTQGAGRTRVT